jgi:hypothetical protein
MKALLVHGPRVEKDRSRRTLLAIAACVLALGLAAHADAQALDSRARNAPAPQDSPRRARTVRPERTGWASQPKRDYADGLDGGSLSGGPIDRDVLEERIRDLSAKVRELNDLLQRQKETNEPVRFQPRPMRATLLERHRPRPTAHTYGEALGAMVRERARTIEASFNDATARTRLAIDPEPAEVRRLLEPIDAWLGASGTPAERAHAHMQALIYATLLEERAKIDPPEPLPVAYKLLRDLHIDRRALAEHLRRSFLLDPATVERELGTVLAATATAFPEPSSMRDFLKWLAEGVGADLKDELVARAAYPYRADPLGQFDAAAENAIHDNADVLKLQVQLQRMLVEANALRAARSAAESTAGAWQHRLLQAERELDRLLRAADSEREAVMTLVRRMPIAKDTAALVEPALDSLSIEPAETVASDDLTTQH